MKISDKNIAENPFKFYFLFLHIASERARKKNILLYQNPHEISFIS